MRHKRFPGRSLRRGWGNFGEGKFRNKAPADLSLSLSSSAVCLSPPCPVQSAYTDTFHILNTTPLRRFGGRIYIRFLPRHFTDKTYISWLALHGITPRMTCTSLAAPKSPRFVTVHNPIQTQLFRRCLSSGSTQPLLFNLFRCLEDNLFLVWCPALNPGLLVLPPSLFAPP